MKKVPTRLTIRALSSDAKIIGSLVGGCRVKITHRISGEVLSEGLHLGGSGSSRTIMEEPRKRGATVFDTQGTAAFHATLDLEKPTPVKISVEGPLAYPQAIQESSTTTWLLPGQHLEGEGLVLTLYGFIVDILSPLTLGVAELRSRSKVHLEAGVFLL